MDEFLRREKALEEARRCAFSWMMRLYGLGESKILCGELFQYVGIFARDTKDLEQSFLRRFGSPDVTDPIEGMTCAYEGYRQALEALWNTLEKSDVITGARNIALAPQTESITYCGRLPQYPQ